MRYDDPDVPASALVGIVGAIVLFLIIVGLQTLFYRAEQAETVSKVYQTDSQALTRLRADQLEELHSYRWIDQQKGTVAIPIERAMELVVEESRD